MKPKNSYHSDYGVTINNRASNEDHYFDTNLLEELANATWGRSWPNGSKKYVIDRDGYNWYARHVHNSHQYFLIHLNFDYQLVPRSFTLFHARGETETQDISESELRAAIRQAYKAGPVQGDVEMINGTH